MLRRFPTVQDGLKGISIVLKGNILLFTVVPGIATPEKETTNVQNDLGTLLIPQ